jgi:hypothetical protein
LVVALEVVVVVVVALEVVLVVVVAVAAAAAAASTAASTELVGAAVGAAEEGPSAHAGRYEDGSLVRAWNTCSPPGGASSWSVCPPTIKSPTRERASLQLHSRELTRETHAPGARRIDHRGRATERQEGRKAGR